MKTKIVGLLGFLAMALLAQHAQAVPLRLDYSIVDIGGGLYRYDFRLILDNNDGSWEAGQQFDWITYGDRQGSYDAPSGFCPVECDYATVVANTTGVDDGFYASVSVGGHQGPILGFGQNALLPGWEPAAVGAFTDWSFTSSIYLPQGQLYWSSIQRNYDFQNDFYLAYQRVPEPGTLALLGLGLAGLGLSRRRKTA